MDEKTAVTREVQAAELATLLPPVDIVEDATGITVYADLPGVPREKLNIEVDGETLSIEGEMDMRMPEGMEATHAEVSVPRFRRVFTLSKELDTSKLEALLTQGVLKLHIQKAPHAKPRRISVQPG
ncbi:MAG: Hsp20/alpha crystallin family protein [Acidobacteriota bacterium]